MDGKDKNAKKDSVEETALEAAKCKLETVKCKLAANWKVIAGILVVVIILLNTFWNMTESKISSTVTQAMGSITVAEEMESFKTALKTELESNFANLDARLSELEKRSIDVEMVKEDIAAIRKAGEDFEKKLLAIIKAEELKLAGLEKDAETQKTYIDELKTLLEGAAK